MLPKIGVVVTADTKQAEAGLDRVQKELTQTGAAADNAAKRTDAMGATLNRTAGRSSAFGRGLQNASFQMADFASQVGAGTSASVALGQQLPQLLGGFGILGAVLGAVVAVAVPLTRAFQGMSEQGRDMSEVLGVLSPLADRLASAFQTVAEVGVQMAEVIINNLDRILITAGLVAGFFAAKWVAAFVAARVATFSLAAAMTALRTALIRTGIGALVVAAGEGVYQFTRLAGAVGGVSEAFGLIMDVFEPFTTRFGELMSALVLIAEGVGQGIYDGIVAGIKTIKKAVDDYLVTPIINGLNFVIRAAQKLGASIQEIALPSSGAEGDDKSIGLTRPGSDIPQQTGADKIRAGMGRLGAALTTPIDLTSSTDAITKIRDILASIKEDRITLPDLLGVGADDGEGGGKKKTPLEEQTEAQIASLQALKDQGRETWSALGSFLQQFAGKSKAAAIAAIAIQKGLSIAQIISNTAAAQMRALAELGPIAGPPVAAKMGLYGKLQAGLVAATGLAQAMGSGGSAGGSAPSLGGGAGTTQPAQPPQPTQTVAINLQGDTFSRSSVEGLLEQIQSQLDRGGRLVFQ